MLRKGCFTKIPAICLTILAISLLAVKVYDICMKAEKYSMISSRYLKSADGVTVIPDRYYFYDMRTMNAAKDYWTRHDDGTAGAPITILPESIANIENPENSRKYKNLVIKISDQAWYIKLSKDNQPKYRIRKWVKPVFLGKELASRPLIPEENEDIIVSSTPQSVSMIYYNDRPYLQAEIERISP